MYLGIVSPKGSRPWWVGVPGQSQATGLLKRLDVLWGVQIAREVRIVAQEALGLVAMVCAPLSAAIGAVFAQDVFTHGV